ncbi:MAG: FMN-dependent oxidoreductase (nitrilotriacetate monooxygenase family) [Gammaproteobacteria bacterium]
MTLSTSFVPPYHIARQLSTLEHLTGNRVGWNVVTSYSQADFQAMGMESMVAPDERYARAEEFIQICHELWDAYDDGAIVRDVETGVFADPAKIREINYNGKYLRCKTRPHTLPLSPNRRPVIWQAGASPAGHAFAARYADSVFQVAPNAQAMRPYADDIRSRVENEGRDPNEIKIIFGAQTVVAESRAQAQEKHDELRDAMAMDSVLTMMSGHMGPDFSTFDLDKDISEASTDPALQGVRSAVETILNIQDGDNDPITLKQVAYYYGMAVLTPILVGTAKDIADELEHLLDDGGGDGFMLLSTYVPDCYREFCDFVVPELQRRGRFRKAYSGKTLRHHLTEY